MLLLNTDKNRLKQILINLIANSIKYTIDGYVTLEISSSENNVKISVADTGIGMNELQMEKLFQPFNKIIANRNIN